MGSSRLPRGRTNAAEVAYECNAWMIRVRQKNRDARLSALCSHRKCGYMLVSSLLSTSTMADTRTLSLRYAIFAVKDVRDNVLAVAESQTVNNPKIDDISKTGRKTGSVGCRYSWWAKHCIRIVLTLKIAMVHPEQHVVNLGILEFFCGLPSHGVAEAFIAGARSVGIERRHIQVGCVCSFYEAIDWNDVGCVLCSTDRW